MQVTWEALRDKTIIRRKPGGWNAHEHDLKKFMGLDPKAKWPRDGMDWRDVQGVQVRVLSLTEARIYGYFHRAVCKCPQCQTIVSAGRLHQHIVACKGAK